MIAHRFALLVALGAALLTAGAHASGTVIVHPEFGGTLQGYGIDPGGTEGLLSEYVALENGNSFIATETFDQKTGKIVKVLAKKNNTLYDYGTWGVFGQHIGLDEYYQGGTNTFPVLAPLDGNAFNATWSPQIQDGYLLWDFEGNTTTSDVAVVTYENGGNGTPLIFSSNIAANTFGSPVAINDTRFCFCAVPVAAYDRKNNTAVLATFTGTGNNPELAIADLTSGKVTEFAGVGAGFVNGIAVDPKTGLAVTTTEGDALDQAGVQFYDLKKQTGFQVILPCSDDGAEALSGLTVSFDPVHSLFLVQQYATTCSDGTAIDVYDESGNLVEMLTDFQQLGTSPVPVVLNPKQRSGFIMGDRIGTTLQSFTY